MELTIRELKSEDARAISLIIKDNLVSVNNKDYPQNVIDYMVGYYTPEKIIEKASQKEYFVAEEDGIVVGCIGLGGDEIFTLFVDPGCQGRRLGQNLLNYLEGYAKSKGIKRVRVASSLTAYSFYKKMGYCDIEQVQDDKMGEAIVMDKIL